MTVKISITDQDSGEQIGQTGSPQTQPQVIKPTPTPSELDSPPAFVHPIPTSEPPLEEMAADVPSPEVPRFGTLQPKIDAHPLFSGAKEPAPKNRRWLKRTLAPLAGLIVLLIILYLTIDAGLVKGYSHLPFHFFKAPISESAPVITPAKTTTTSPAVNPYVGWSSYVLPKEKATFKYPADWKLVDQNASVKNPPTDQDAFQLTAPDGFIVSIAALPGGGTGGDDSKILSADPITFIGQSDYLQYKSLSTGATTFSGTVDTGSLSTNAAQKYMFPLAKNNVSASKASSNATVFNIGFSFPSGKGVKTVSGNSDITTTKLIIESMYY